jgi:tetratricopeptide (TPR) repeat protein
LYSRQDDYVNAIKYIKESIGVITANEKSPSVNPRDLIRSYYILSVFYNELGRTTERIKATDDCIAVAIKEKSADTYVLNSMWDRIDYSYNIGDYERSYDIAEAGEAATKQYAHERNNADYVAGFQALKVKALLAMREYDKVQKELQNKIEECIKTGSLMNLGTIWEQMAEVFAEKGDLLKAEQYFQKAFQYDLKRGYKIGCAQTLNNLAYLLYFKKYRDFDKAIVTHKKAIAFLGDPKLNNRATDVERMNIYGNLAAIFVQKSLYDSAGVYFQYAFDQIQPGINEYTIFQNSLIDTIQYSRVNYLADLMTAKGDAYVKRYKELNNKQDLVKAIRIYKLTDQLLDNQNFFGEMIAAICAKPPLKPVY